MLEDKEEEEDNWEQEISKISKEEKEKEVYPRKGMVDQNKSRSAIVSCFELEADLPDLGNNV